MIVVKEQPIATRNLTVKAMHRQVLRRGSHGAANRAYHANGGFDLKCSTSKSFGARKFLVYDLFKRRQ
jgi:hypothetical protein